LSSAILYFAIVAIWAGILMPRWLRPSAHRHRAEEAQPEAAPEIMATFAQPGLEAEDSQPTPDWAAEDAAARRANILRARRRMLTTLVVLTLGAFGIAVTGIAAWWVIVPPGVLLAGFLLLLREAARSDRARAHHQAHTAEPRGTETGEAGAGPRRRPGAQPDEPEVFERIASTPEAPQPEPAPAPTAEIIDISARVNDQLYDQYTDAAERAVGD
jgi:hypothetical protein